MDLRGVENYFESGRLSAPEVLNAKATARHGGFLKELQRRVDRRNDFTGRSQVRDKERAEMERYFPGLTGKSAKTRSTTGPSKRPLRDLKDQPAAGPAKQTEREGRADFTGREEYDAALHALGAPGSISTARIVPRSTIAEEIKNSPEHRRLYEAAQDFQAIFIRMLLKSMRSTLDRKADILHGGRSQEIFEDMLYDEYSEVMSRQSTFQLSDMLYRQLAPGLGAPGVGAPPEGRSETGSKSGPPT